MKLVILDRDGVINHDSPAFIKNPDEWIPIPGSLEAIARLNQAGCHVVLATNAFAGEWDITPRNLSVPIYVVEVETEPIDPVRIAALGWTSGMGLVTQHAIMENYRLTPDRKSTRLNSSHT